jgi:hypothetical protein
MGPLDSYPAARLVAPRVRAYFERHRDAGSGLGTIPVAPLPETAAIEQMVNAAFWTSLRREEGYVPKISLAYLPPDPHADPLVFERPLALTAGTLAKVGPIVERPGIHLGVWHEADALVVWGTTRTIPPLCMVLEVVEPGLLVVKHHRGELSGKYANVAVLEGDQIKIVDESLSALPSCPSLLTSLLGIERHAPSGSVNVLVQLAVSMRAHGRGGSLLIVPAGTERWRESIVAPIPYAVTPPYAGLSSLMRMDDEARQPHVWREALREAVDAVAGLSAVDGATVMADDYALLAFGAKIARRRGSPQVEQVTLSEPIEGGVPSIVPPSQLGGTRHLSAAQFVHDNHEAVALVASQDRRFTVFTWSESDDQLHAHRVETLLI